MHLIYIYSVMQILVNIFEKDAIILKTTVDYIIKVLSYYKRSNIENWNKIHICFTFTTRHLLVNSFQAVQLVLFYRNCQYPIIFWTSTCCFIWVYFNHIFFIHCETAFPLFEIIQLIQYQYPFLSDIETKNRFCCI